MVFFHRRHTKNLYRGVPPQYRLSDSPWHRGLTVEPTPSALGVSSLSLQLGKSLKPRLTPRFFRRAGIRRIKNLGQGSGLLYPWGRLRPIDFLLSRRLPQRLRFLNSYASAVQLPLDPSIHFFSRQYLIRAFGSKLIPQIFSSRRSARLQTLLDRKAFPHYRFGNGSKAEFYGPIAHSFYRPFFRTDFLNAWNGSLACHPSLSRTMSGSYFYFSRLYRLSYLHLHRRFLNFKLFGASFFRFHFPRPHKLGFEIWRRRRNLFISFVLPSGSGPFFRTTVGSTGLRGPDKRSFEAPRQVAIKAYQWLSKKFMRRYSRPDASLPTFVFRIRSALTSKMRSVFFYFFKFVKTLSRLRARGRVVSAPIQPSFHFLSRGFLFSKPKFVHPFLRPNKPPKQLRQPPKPTSLPARLSSLIPVFARRKRTSISLFRLNYHLPSNPFVFSLPNLNPSSVSFFSHGLYLPRRSHGGLVRFSAVRRRKNRRRLKVKRRLGFSNSLA